MCGEGRAGRAVAMVSDRRFSGEMPESGNQGPLPFVHFGKGMMG